MAEPVSELIVAIRADITQLRADLEKGKREYRKATKAMVNESRSLQRSIKGLKEPISNVAQLANGLGTAFGGAASKATGLINGVVSGFSAGGLMGVAIGGAIGLVSILADRHTKAGEAAVKAAEDGARARAEENKKIQATIDKLDEEIKRRNILLRGGDVEFETKQAEATSLADQAAQARANAEQVRAELNDLKAQFIGNPGSERMAKWAEERWNKLTGGDIGKRKAELSGALAEWEQKAAALGEAAAKAGENVEGIALTNLSTPITPETMTPASRTSAENKPKGDAEAEAKRLLEQQERDRLALRRAYAITARDQALVAYQEELEAINALTVGSEKEKLAAKEAAHIRYLDRVAELEADHTARLMATDQGRKEANADALKAESDAAEERLRGLENVAGSFGNLVSDAVILPLQDGFRGLADFADMAKRFIIGLIAKLIAAAAAALLLNVLLGGAPMAAGAGAGAAAGAQGFSGIFTKMLGFAEGGSVSGPGGPKGDRVPAMLSDGEYVLRAEAVQRVGTDFLDAINQGAARKMASGGPVTSGRGPGTQVNVMAFDAPAIRNNVGKVEGVQRGRLNANQGGLYQRSVRRAVERRSS